ncbi:hypothetical protein DL769_001174 [Monosporascus sp. CRB-8-3]|nr:hypothetical protein DL769_001174 [Monosporascus sp. CRB-8-3]
MKSCLPLAFLPSALGLVAPVVRQELVELFEPEDRDTIVQDEYHVLIRDVSELSDHWEKLGKDLSQDEACQDYQWFKNLNSYVCTITDSALLDEIRQDTDNVEVVAAGTITPWKTDRETAKKRSPNELTERWGKDVSQDGPWWIQQMTASEKLTDTPDQGLCPHMEDPLPGAGVKIYVLDTGINVDHELFYSGPNEQQPHRALHFLDFGPDDSSPFVRRKDADKPGNNRADFVMNDNDGHGTAVASMAASWQHGIGLRSTVVNVKVISNSVSIKHLGAGVEFRGSVINISAGGLKYHPALEGAIRAAISAGIPIFAAAENEEIDQADGTNIYPCALDSQSLIYRAGNRTLTRHSYDQVFCVSSTDREYNRAPESAYGRLINAFAPGEGVQAAIFSANTGTGEFAGTSFAAPHAAAMASLVLGYETFERLDTPDKVYTRLEANYLQNIVGRLPEGSDTPNNFITTGINHPDRQDGCPYAGLTSEECAAIDDEK